jgi:glycosyltransferase involved in cell wall biosynthesis
MTNSAPTISVVVCTRNRSASLLRTLESIQQMNVPAEIDWELIVVDNNSNDDTRDVVESFQKTSGFPVIYLLERRPGAAYARNCGIGRAKGDVIAFTDDDMIVAPEWLVRIVERAASDPSAVLYFGQTRTMRADHAQIATRLGDTEETFVFPCNPVAPGSSNNMIARKSAVTALGGFDITLGPGTVCRAAEDTDFTYRILLAGGIVRYCPEILAYHDHRRLSPQAVRAQIFSYGIANGALYCKHIIRRDTYALKTCYWEIKAFVRVFIERGKASTMFFHLMGMAKGFGVRLGVEAKTWLTGTDASLASSQSQLTTPRKISTRR